MKKILFLLAVSILSMAPGSTVASAQKNEKVITASVSYLSPSNMKVLDEYISSQIYSGSDSYNGWNIKLSALYKKHDNLSWDLYFKTFTQASWMKDVSTFMANPSHSQYLKYNGYSLGYGTYYHWNIGKKLMIKTGGIFDIYGAMKESTPNGVNNYLNMEGQIIINAHGAIKYGWDFKKWALDLSARVSLPVIGVISADHPSEPAMSIFGNNTTVMDPAYNHIFLASYHNYMSLNYDLNIDFVFKPCTVTLGYGSTNKWWNVYDVQNIRNINYLSIGLSFDLVSRNKFQSSNKNF